VLLEGHADDVAAQERAAGLERIDGPPHWPDGPHRGRISVVAARIPALGRALDAVPGLRWLAEVGVGTVHVASERVDAVAAARAAAESDGGWLLREAGDLEPFGAPIRNAALMRRIRESFDPTGKMNPGRLPW
jgi:FAD/FMN-containing dehydrogenase